jgi:hypothetical protein
MTIEELEARGAPRWILEGLGAGGLDGELPVDQYLKDNASTTDVRVRAAIDAIANLVAGRPAR